MTLPMQPLFFKEFQLQGWFLALLTQLLYNQSAILLSTLCRYPEADVIPADT